MENLILKNKSRASVSGILIEYSYLKQKLENTDNHSFYFKKGLVSKREILACLVKDFEEIRTFSIILQLLFSSEKFIKTKAVCYGITKVISIL